MTKQVRTVAETRSTNDDVAAAARTGAAEGLWLRAEHQSGGRGRHGRRWTDAAGNLHASTLVRLRPGDPPAPTLALVAAVALDELACAYAPASRLFLKWPNDLMADAPEGAAKLAGILLERIEDAVVIGFGVNLADAPTLPDRPATSLAAVAGSAPDPAAFVEELAAAFARWLARWRGEGLAPVRRRWIERAHAVGTPLATTGPDGRRVEGLYAGLEADGALRLRLADGGLYAMHAGDVALIGG